MTGARRSPAPAHRASPPRRELDTIARFWQSALDAAGSALDAETAILPAAELASRRRRLTAERLGSGTLLGQLAHVRGIKPEPWLPPIPVTPFLLGLDKCVQGCIFDLEGVLTDSGPLHAAAWAHVFDSYLLGLAHDTGWQFAPFDPASDYLTYLDGRLRIDGIHAFLASRGLRVPEGRAQDSPDASTAYGLARRKGQLLARALETRGLATLSGGRRYLQATGYAQLGRAVVAASSSTVPMLELVGLEHLIETHVDANAMQREGLHPRPAPDLLLAACRGLGVDPARAATLTHTGAGVVAGRRAGLASVIGIGSGTRAELLRDFGADIVVPSLLALLDARLVEGAHDEPHRRA
jgi:beta-phosphoglucomutase-like phosphatase (HAD superfamily)